MFIAHTDFFYFVVVNKLLASFYVLSYRPKYSSKSLLKNSNDVGSKTYFCSTFSFADNYSRYLCVFVVL